MRAHPRQDDACLVSGAVKNPYRLLRSLRARVEVVGVVVDERGSWTADGYPVWGAHPRWLRLYARTLVWNLLTLPKVWRLFARADVVQCHHPNLGLGAAVLHRLVFRRVPLVVKAHGTGVPELAANRYGGVAGIVFALNARLHRRHDRLVLRWADRCLVSSDHQVEEMVDLYGVARDRIVRTYNGIDPEFAVVRHRTGPEAVAAPRLVFVGRVVPKKGFHRLHDLYRGVLAHHPQASLTLVLGHRGSVEDAGTFRFVQERLAPMPGCRLLFDLDERTLYEVLAGSDIGLVPSEGYESIPTVVLEMCGAGLPVFATARWGIPEVLPPRFGLSGDLAADVGRIVAFIAAELADWDSTAWAAAYERFRYDRLVRDYDAVYRDVLAA
jgi:glycosyltransferase involved in cell wall biosynthesis